MCVAVTKEEQNFLWKCKVFENEENIKVFVFIIIIMSTRSLFS